MTTLGLSIRLIDGVARLLVLALLVSSAGPLLHGQERHDADCDPLLVLHDASQHRITSDARQPADAPVDHCAACHWARAFRSPQLASTSMTALGAGLRLVHTSSTAPRSQIDLRLPARAPPSFA